MSSLNRPSAILWVVSPRSYPGNILLMSELSVGQNLLPMFME